MSQYLEMTVIIVYLIFAIIIGICIHNIHLMPKRKEFNFKPSLIGMMASVLSTTIFTLILFCTPLLASAINNQIFSSRKLILCFQGLYFISFDFLVYFLMEFVHKYTRYTPKFPWFTIVLICLLSLDTANLLLNFSLNHVFIIPTSKIGEVNKFIPSPGIPVNMLNLHYFITYIPVIIAVAALVLKIIKSPSFYKNQYICILVAVLISLIGDALYITLPEFKTNLSVFLFNIACLYVYYFAVHYSPKKLISNFQNQLISNMDDAVIAFDINGDCIFVNKKFNQSIYKYRNYNTDKVEPFSNWDTKSKTLKKEFITKINDFRNLLVQEKRSMDEEKPSLINFHFDNIKITDGRDIQYFRGHFKTLHDTYNGNSEKQERILGYFYTLHNFTSEQEKINEQNFKSSHDELTGIYNRGKFEEEVRNKLFSDHESTYMMICSDVEHFKLINELFGKAAADLLLLRIAKHIQALAKPGDVYGRIQSDRFALLIKKDDFKEFQFITESALCAYMDDNRNYPVNINIGVYEIEDVKLPVAVMCDRAFMAIEKINGNSASRIAYYSEDIRNSIIKAQELIGQFRTSLKNGDFQIFIQPQSTISGECKGGEALVRWMHPTDGIINPDRFISLLEKNGIITELDTYVWELAAKKLKEWKEKGYNDYYISVNISHKDLAFIDIYNTFKRIVEKYDISPSNLKLEITESAVLMNLDIQLKLINKLRAAGFKIQMDDFGSGYSSLNMLKDIPFDVLKIDMAFLEKTENVTRSKIILKSIVEMATALEIDVITEGVETKEQADYLNSIGCNLFQGYYFDRPMPVSDFETKYLK